MFNKIFKLSDDQIKNLFDHFRNLGICSAIFAASDWQYAQTNSPSFGLGIFNASIFILLVLLGTWLLLITLIQACRKLKDYGFKGTKLIFVSGFYGLAVISLIISIFVH